jgi:glucokinase
MNERVAAAIDVGGTKIAIGLVNAQGRILAQDETPTAPEQGYQAALARTVAVLHRLLEESGLSVDGIGIGSTGPIDPDTGIYGVVGTLPGWEGSPLAADLEREFGLSVAVENDADAAALGEAAWGAGRGSRSLLYVTISTGIGVGILLDGKLYRGAEGAHPEIGHHVIDWSGPLCYCGANGCWETLASGPALEAWMSAQRVGALSASEICELARQGDALALEAVQREALYIGLGLANLVTMYCPQTIVVGGGMMRSADLLLAPALDLVKRICTQVPVENTSIVLAGLGAQCGLLGGACVWFHQAGVN